MGKDRPQRNYIKRSIRKRKHEAVSMKRSPGVIKLVIDIEMQKNEVLILRSYITEKPFDAALININSHVK